MIMYHIILLSYNKPVSVSVKNSIVTIYALKMKNLFIKKKLSSRRIFLQKYFAQKIQNKNPNHPVFLTKLNV